MQTQELLKAMPPFLIEVAEARYRGSHFLAADKVVT